MSLLILDVKKIFTNTSATSLHKKEKLILPRLPTKTFQKTTLYMSIFKRTELKSRI